MSEYSDDSAIAGPLTASVVLFLVVWAIMAHWPEKPGTDRELRKSGLVIAPMSHSPKDRDLMIRVAIWESRQEPRLGQMGVVFVIKNRWKNNPYGWRTISDVVTAKNQFEPWLRHRKKLLAMPKSGREYQNMASIVDDVLADRVDDPTNGAFYFLNVNTVKKRNGGKLPAGWRRIVAQAACRKIARHTFCPR